MLKLLILTVMCLLPKAHAEVGVASGFSAVTGGRTVPLLYASGEGNEYAVTAYSVGVNTSVYYHSGYMASLFKRYKPSGDFISGGLDAGLGWGLYYYKIGFKRSSTAALEEKSATATGPAFRVLWNLAPPVFVGIEGMYGIRGLNWILLSTQDIVSVLLGVRF
ncbi:MAG: hypothetical protein A2X86_07205 [Bdellovibrionales bacterium GWA2_49_15]|nr:MAG: hypothetical protein A2X86_07205 [Bdellovibrionales bacterium GWA2_49_15]HAZ11936.1 hypothetical protein [Bdellovibrionales bacterium]